MKKLLSMLLILFFLFVISTFLFNGDSVTLRYNDSARYTAGNAELHETIAELDIDWLAGSVTIGTHAGADISVVEIADDKLNNTTRLHWWLDGDTLRIRFGAEGRFTMRSADKHLTVLLPEGTALASLLVDTESADLRISGIEAKNMQLNAATGDITVMGDANQMLISAGSGNILVNGSAELLLLNATAGEVSVIGSADHLQANTTSGEIYANLTNIAQQVVMTSASGSITFIADDAPLTMNLNCSSGSVYLLLLPSANFTATLNAAPGGIHFSLPAQISDNTYTCGTGESRITVNTTSGGISVGVKESAPN